MTWAGAQIMEPVDLEGRTANSALARLLSAA
jgi:hypothetical protein